jgi:hypothetical protein
MVRRGDIHIDVQGHLNTGPRTTTGLDAPGSGRPARGEVALTTRAAGSRRAYLPGGVPVPLASRQRHPGADDRWPQHDPGVIGAGSHDTPSRPPAVGVDRKGPASCPPSASSQDASNIRQYHLAPQGCSRVRAVLDAHPGDVAGRAVVAVHPRFASRPSILIRRRRVEPGTR